MTSKHYPQKRDFNKTPELEGKIKNPLKVLYPEDQITKKDLFNYYDTISDYILPYLSQRPLTLVRCPDLYSQCFYQRHYNESTPKALHAIQIKHDDSAEQYIYLNDKAGLLSLIQMGVLEIHPWGSRIPHLDKPDRIIFDLDPAPLVTWEKVVAAAFDVKEQLEHHQLQSFVKSTGGKGLHVVVPIKPEHEWEKVKNFAHYLAQFLEKQKPNNYVSTISKEKRQGKIFIDYLRNQWAATAIGNYSTRAHIHAPVAIPLAWNELSNRKEDNSYTIKTVLKRLSHLKEEPWHDFWRIKQSLPELT
ncbi:non-homologous end-joining DNA ligase [Legionella fallonii]|uniref:non-homologous end-joining DNA ligase n=1 Tax=Legionella fallonii TaxID=96230 RepID=UPI0005D348AC|nr:non-homologous end-joining DNA ligase [Legionella fallonii]